MCVVTSYVHDSLPPIGGESKSGSTRSCRWEAESSGRTTTIECFVFAIGMVLRLLLDVLSGGGGAGGLDFWHVGSRRRKNT